jgi:ABC-2 type transport system permease protein
VSLALLFRDEIAGFYRSRAMVALWVGLPVLTILLYLLTPDLEGVPVAVFTALLVGSLGGSLASAMLAVGILSEREHHVYDLFVIRPVRRRDLLVAKFLAVYACVLVAALLALAVGILADALVPGHLHPIDGASLEASMIILASMLAISSSAGILIGVVSPSALVAVILVLYGGNQLSTAAILPVLLKVTAVWFPLLPGAALSAGLLALSIWVFGRREL